MPDLLLELFSEEIPARMQRKAAADLQKLVTDALVERGLFYEGAKAFATPRRLALTIHGLPARSPDQKEETKGPPVSANEQAIAGFLRKTGLKSIAEAKVQSDKKKGDFYVAVVEKPGRDAVEVIAEILPPIIRSFPWPKSMRWGKRSSEPGSLTWVRPLHSILCVFGPETSDTEVVPFEIDGIRSGNVTYGHRFLAPAPITVRRFDDYMAKLEAARVVLDADRRKQMILADARDRALAVGLELVEDEALLEEVAGLVEWPVVLMGSFDEAFLEIPPEVIRTTIRVNQKCFVLRHPRAASPRPGEERASSLMSGSELGTKGEGAEPSSSKSGTPSPQPSPLRGEGALANRFILVANIEATDGGTAIVAGNQRVIRARLSDARHFWETDLKPLPDYRDKAAKPLDQRLEKLKALNIVFHEKLGTQGQRVERIARLAKSVTELIGFDPRRTAAKFPRAVGGDDAPFGQLVGNVARAAQLAKADLVTEMVGEFPELQGLMGKYYALQQGEDASVATAIEDHYKPVGPGDRVPIDPVAIAVALADKVDTLTAFWAIDEKPTGNKDPYALRRAALGVIRIALENGLELSLSLLIGRAVGGLVYQNRDMELIASVEAFIVEHMAGATELTSADRLTSAHRAAKEKFETLADDARPRGGRGLLGAPSRVTIDPEQHSMLVGRDPTIVNATTADLLAFFADRLKVQLREQGARHDLVDAVFALGNQDDLLLIVRRVEALGKFLETEDGKSLLAGAKRAANILRDEEKKSGETYTGAVDAALTSEPAEKALAAALDIAVPAATAAVEKEEFGAAMTALAGLRAPVDAFFEQVRVNADDPAVRVNRLRLLNRIREATLAVADFSKIAG